MPTLKLVISDLHLADGHRTLDGFDARQQMALEGLLDATMPGGILANAGNAADVELVINGDCFDFLAIEPYRADGIATPAIALGKLEKILAAHRLFFDTLRGFVSTGRTVTFIAGNHDIELCFAEVQARIRQAILGEQSGDQEAAIHFCPARFYRPLPDVYIEHGNHFDFWNYASGIWDEHGLALSPAPTHITLPVGTQYFQRASYPVTLKYPYFDHFDPSINSTRQIALLCLLDPAIVVETAHATMKMLSYPRQALAGLASGAEHIPVRLFEAAMIDFAAFHMDMVAHTPGWQAIETVLHPSEDAKERAQAETMIEFLALREALERSPLEAVKAIFAPSTYEMGESVARGMHHVLQSDSTLCYAIAGHTHMARSDALGPGSQIYFNTATWTTRQALPAPEDITVELIDWLRLPEQTSYSLQDRTELVFALINAHEGKPSTVRLCAWEGGRDGNYRVLA